MSTVMEIAAAIERLSAQEQAQLVDRLLRIAPIRPKTGSELAALWPGRSHLLPQEADDLSRDMDSAPQSPPKALAWE